MPKSFIYHMLEEGRWRPHAEAGSAGYLPAAYVEEGFVHCSMDYLVLPVANHFMKGVKGKFVCLRIDPELVKSEVKYESGRSKSWAKYGKPIAPVGDKPTSTEEEGERIEKEPVLFPHIYGPIESGAVVAELTVARSEDGTFVSIEGLC